MIHERLDIAHWKSVFSLARLRDEARVRHQRQPEACVISGPYDIAVLEQLREESYARLSDVERVPTDVFVWARGESERREVTKIAGLPYWEARNPWPVAPSGTPMNFVAQICFADSRDLIPKLPGDILLIFAEGKEWSAGEYDFTWGDYDDSDSAIAFEWVGLGDFPLVTPAEVPETGWQIMPCHAHIHRTWDYPDVDGFAYPHVAEHVPSVFEATKIGGVSPWLDEEDDGPGEYLCSLSSLASEITKPFPFINVPEPISWKDWSDSHRLMIGDVGLLNFFINTYGDLRWTGHSH
jgi:hypothetical protein